MAEITDLSVKDIKYLISLVDRERDEFNTYIDETMREYGGRITKSVQHSIFELAQLDVIYTTLKTWLKDLDI